MNNNKGGIPMAGLLTFFLSACSGQSVQKTEHGLRTDRVVATRMKNDTMGQFVKFDFPKNGYDADRAEVSLFIEMNGGNVFEGGGAPYAPAYATFEGVKGPSALDQIYWDDRVVIYLTHPCLFDRF